MRREKTACALCAAFIFALAPILGGCGVFSNDDAPQTEEMSVNVDFLEMHRCSRISPPITVAYAPKGTKFYDIKLVEYGSQERPLGGGTWPEDGDGLIPEGALTRHYSGPCPQADRQTTYAYIVSAMEKENSPPLAVRVFRLNPD